MSATDGRCSTLTGSFAAPWTQLTRQYSPIIRRDYADGLTVVTYQRPSADGRDFTERQLVWNRADGYRTQYGPDGRPQSGFLWVECSAVTARRAWLLGHRASSPARWLMGERP